MALLRITRRRIAGTATVAAIAAFALGIGSAPSVAARATDASFEGHVHGSGSPEAVKDSYIIILKKTSSAASPSGRAIVHKFGAQIERTYQSALNGYAVTLPSSRARQLAADPAVEAVVQNRRVSLSATQPSPPSWGMDRIDQRALPLNGSYAYPDSAGTSVTAYIIDTGVRISHNDFGGRARYGYDAVDNDNTAQDGHGHGTHVAGTVAGNAYGVAKKASVVAVRVLNNQGSGTIAQVVAGIDWVTQNAVHPAVANMSLGGGADVALDTAVRNSIASGITYAVAAGNSNSDASNYSPARVAEAITVGSTANTDARSSFSNYGGILDVFAPGSSITSAWNSSDTAVNTISGTSMATPHVTGAAALYLAANPSATPAQVSTALTTAATTGTVSDPGVGSPNRLLFVNSITTPPPGKKFENNADYTIADFMTAHSPITVSGVSGSAPTTLAVSVDVKHTYIGDLQVDLIAPDGTAYRLKNYGTGGSSDNLLTTYTVNASSELANGIWGLRVRDNALYDTGKIDAWSLQF
ncbi:S8 family serine peptidase [Streptomyces sp. NPDC053431]|uniref:S8 family peptidase n=1 Tax=Streptomyces sp. NPDC053431 TaxID=3365703 RepID=UPI0037CE78C5